MGTECKVFVVKKLRIVIKENQNLEQYTIGGHERVLQKPN